MTKEELVALIQQIVRQHPELETMVEITVSGASATGAEVDPTLIRRRVQTAFRGVGYEEWGAAYDISRPLSPLMSLAASHLNRQDYRNAAVSYQTLADTVLDHYEMVDDEDGEISQLVNACVEGLGTCLENAQDPVLREFILRSLFNIFLWDVNYGGISIGEDVPEIISQYASPDERRALIEWTRAALTALDSDRALSDYSRDYRKKVLGEFLLELERESLDDETYLSRCRELGLVPELIERLLQINRVEAAVRETRKVQDYMLLQMLELFRRYGQTEVAIQLVRERLASGPQTHFEAALIEWLRARAEEQNDFAEALKLALQLFWRQPSASRYLEVKYTAQKIDRWEEVQNELLMRLDKQGEYALLTQIYLLEQDVEQALESFEKVQANEWELPHLRLQVAEVAEKEYPRNSIQYYLQLVQQMIQATGRDNYAGAARLLLRVRELYRRLGEEGTWQSLITDLREQYPRHRALQDEWNKAGL